MREIGNSVIVMRLCECELGTRGGDGGWNVTMRYFAISVRATEYSSTMEHSGFNFETQSTFGNDNYGTYLTSTQATR